MTSTLSPDRQLQIRRAHAALDRGDTARALDFFAMDLDGFIERVKSAVERIDGRKYPEQACRVGRPTDAVTAVQCKGTLPLRLARNEAIRAVLLANPMAETKALCHDFDVSEKVVRRIRQELGIKAPSLIRAKNLMKAYSDLVAERGQICDSLAAEILRQSKATIYDVRYRYSGGKRKRQGA